MSPYVEPCGSLVREDVPVVARQGYWTGSGLLVFSNPGLQDPQDVPVKGRVSGFGTVVVMCVCICGDLGLLGLIWKELFG